MTPEEQADAVMVGLRKAGFNVILEAIPPRPWEFTPSGVLRHETYSSTSIDVEVEESDVARLKLGESGMPGPAAQWYVGRTGRIYLLAKGGANHAGTGDGLVGEGVPANRGNTHLWGVTVAGAEQNWTKDQAMSARALTDLLCKSMGVARSRVWRYWDYAANVNVGVSSGEV